MKHTMKVLTLIVVVFFVHMVYESYATGSGESDMFNGIFMGVICIGYIVIMNVNSKAFIKYYAYEAGDPRKSMNFILGIWTSGIHSFITIPNAYFRAKVLKESIINEKPKDRKGLVLFLVISTLTVITAVLILDKMN